MPRATIVSEVLPATPQTNQSALTNLLHEFVCLCLGKWLLYTNACPAYSIKHRAASVYNWLQVVYPGYNLCYKRPQLSKPATIAKESAPSHLLVSPN